MLMSGGFVCADDAKASGGNGEVHGVPVSAREELFVCMPEMKTDTRRDTCE